jgi:hypothetical protein
VKKGQRDTSKEGIHGYHGGCPIIHAPWGVSSFASRQFNSLNDMVQPADFDVDKVFKRKKR